MSRFGLAIVFIVIFLIWGGTHIFNSMNYSINVGEYLKRAGDANSIELAVQNLEQALENIDDRGWTSGSTGALWASPKNDIGFWHDNLTSALDELKKVGPNTTPFEKTNVLKKLREITSITVPDGIELFPNNRFFFFWALSSFILACVFIFRAVVLIDRLDRGH